MPPFSRIVSELDAHVERVLPAQIVDPRSPDRGGFVGPDGVAGSSAVSTASSLGYAYLLRESRHFRRAELLERILLAAEFARRRRRPSGCFDLVISNFDSAPDTAFAVQALAPVVVEARQQAGEDRGAAQIDEALGELVRTAAPGMVRGGFHTPNHRWVLVSALAYCRKLFPELAAMAAIDAYLGEGIDINADGEYIERSTGVYNAVVNRALYLSAELLERPELLEPVRRNLDMSYHLLHADATVVTSISSRQDRGQRLVPLSLADSFQALAHLDGNGFYAAVAEWLVEKGGSALVCLPNFITHPEWREQGVGATPLPESYARFYPVSGLWRVRRGPLSATVAAGLSTPFSLRYGQVELRAVKLSSTYFATGQFVGEDFGGDERGVHLHHRGRNRLYPERDYRGGVYFLPVDERVDAGNWEEVRGRRGLYQLPALEVDLEIEEVGGGFDLRVVTSGGLDGVPFQIECVFEPGGELEMDSALVEGRVDSTVFLKGGYAIYRVGDEAIRVGPGEMRHRMWHMRNSESSPGAFRVLVALMAPVERVLEIRCGRWSAGEGGIVVGG